MQQWLRRQAPGGTAVLRWRQETSVSACLLSEGSGSCEAGSLLNLRPTLLPCLPAGGGPL